MLFFLRKFIEALFLPIGISCLLAIVGIALRRRWIVIGGVVVLYMFSLPVVGRLMIQPLERVYDAKTVTESPDADAIVVLSGSIVRGITAPGVQWGDSVNRYFAGFDLAMAGKAKIVVFTAAAADGLRERSQGAVLRQNAIQHGLQPERIILTRSVSTTEDEATAISQIPDIHSILLVTSAFHMPRAVLLFRDRGLDVSPFPTDQQALGGRISAAAFIPSAAALRVSESAIREYYGLAVYRTILLFRSAGHPHIDRSSSVTRGMGASEKAILVPRVTASVL